MSFQQRRKLLMRQCFMPMWDTDTVMFQMSNVTKIITSFPVVRIFSGPEEKDVHTLYDLLKRKEFLKEEPEIKAKKGFILRNAENGYLLVSSDDSHGASGNAVLLNEVSALVWEKLQNPVSKEDLLIAILNAFDVNKAVASADMDILLEKLRCYGMIDDD